MFLYERQASLNPFHKLVFFTVFQSDTHLPSKFMGIYKGKKNLFDDALIVTFFYTIKFSG